MLYVREQSRCDIISEDTRLISAPLQSKIGHLTLGGVYKRHGYVTLRAELVPNIPIVEWETDILKVPEAFRPFAGMYSLDYTCYIYPDGVIKSTRNFQIHDGTMLIYSIYPAL